MKIKIISIGTHMPEWVNMASKDYLKRLSSNLNIDLIEIPLKKRVKNADINRLMTHESEQMKKSIHANDHVIALDVLGKQKSTEDLACDLKAWQGLGSDIALLIGGPEGLHASCLERANAKWSLSKLTFPHPLVRVILAEQIYRAWTILAGHPYHR